MTRIGKRFSHAEYERERTLSPTHTSGNSQPALFNFNICMHTLTLQTNEEGKREREREREHSRGTHDTSGKPILRLWNLSKQTPEITGDLTLGSIFSAHAHIASPLPLSLSSWWTTGARYPSRSVGDYRRSA